jgi:hypothetical protein
MWLERRPGWTLQKSFELKEKLSGKIELFFSWFRLYS